MMTLSYSTMQCYAFGSPRSIIVPLDIHYFGLVSLFEINLEIEITAVGDPPRYLRDTPQSAKVGTNFADKLRWLG
jgi:hypothetical protein